MKFPKGDVKGRKTARAGKKVEKDEGKGSAKDLGDSLALGMERKLEETRRSCRKVGKSFKDDNLRSVSTAFVPGNVSFCCFQKRIFEFQLQKKSFRLLSNFRAELFLWPVSLGGVFFLFLETTNSEISLFFSFFSRVAANNFYQSYL